MALREEFIPNVARRFGALADENRLRLLMRLRMAPANVNTLSQELAIGQASASKHLAVLRDVGLVEVQRNGNQSVYSVRDDSVFDLCQIVCDGVLRQAREEHARLGLGSPTSNKRK